MKKDTLLKLKKNLVRLGLISALSTAPIISNINAYAKEGTVETKENQIDDEYNEIANYISYYSNVFGIKEEIIYDKLDNILFESEEEIELNELLILNTTRDIYYNQSAYGNCRKEGIYEPTLSPEEMARKYSELCGINKTVALSIMYTECGSTMASDNYLSNNNPAGIGPFMYFENKEIGIIYFVNMLKNGYGCTEDSGYAFLDQIGPTYCDESWINLSGAFYNTLAYDYYAYAPDAREEHEKIENDKKEKERIKEVIERKKEEDILKRKKEYEERKYRANNYNRINVEENYRKEKEFERNLVLRK